MNIIQTTTIQEIRQIHLDDDGTFPNSTLPVLFYKAALYIPALFPAAHVKNLFESHGWSNSWDSGIFEFHHYHSITHEVLGIYSGETTLQLGGDNGVKLQIQKGDVIVIPAGVAHKNLRQENDISCVGAYPEGMDYDMNYGKAGERPATDHNIHKLPLPKTDPVYGDGGLVQIWGEQHRNIH
ncbi:MAG: cupin [Bacteroidetes bacterium]|nr:cupin [Bacteroidota bacterium]